MHTHSQLTKEIFVFIFMSIAHSYFNKNDHLKSLSINFPELEDFYNYLIVILLNKRINKINLVGYYIKT